MGTKQEAVEKARGSVRKAGASLAGNLFEDPDFLKVVNRYMLQSHITWAIDMAFLFIGVNYLVIWATETFAIPHLWVGLFLVPAGLVYMLQQWFAYRKKKAKTTVVADARQPIGGYTKPEA